MSGWIALVASGGLLGSQFVVGVIALYNPVRTIHCSNDYAYDDCRITRQKGGSSF